MPFHTALHRADIEFTRQRHTQFRDVQGIQRKGVFVYDGVIPRRAWTVVTVVITGHIVIVGKPVGIVVDAMAHQRFTEFLDRHNGAGFTARRHLIGKLSGCDFTHGSRNIDQNPVVKIIARQIGGHFAIDLIDIRRIGRCAVVHAQNDERLRAFGHFRPCQMRVFIISKAHAHFLINLRKGKLRWNHAIIRKTVAVKFHVLHSF